MGIRLGTIPQRDRQTDRQTDINPISISRVNMLMSRNKNEMSVNSGLDILWTSKH